jgi:hypothetical protein
VTVQIPAQRLFARIGELTMALELASERIAELEAAQASQPAAEEGAT